MDYPSSNFLNEVRESLTPIQYNVFDACINGTENLFCTGDGGVGKSRILRLVVKYFREFCPYIQVAVTASTGSASYNVNGMTLHKFVGAGIEEKDIEVMYRRASRNPSASYWKDTDVLIIDEISMISSVFFESISKVGMLVRQSGEPFGGIRIIAFGDFLQLPPVSREPDLGRRVFHTDAWRDLNICNMYMTESQRQTDSLFRDVLSGVRYGICSDLAEEYIKDLERPIEYDDGIEPVKLFATKDKTNSYNEEKLATLPHDEVVFVSRDKGNTKLLNQCPAPNKLHLRVGAQVILTRNISDDAVNGSVGTIVDLSRDVHGVRMPLVRLTNRDGVSFEMHVSKVYWEVTAPDTTVLASRYQYPIILAWAMTIHRSQGKTIPRLCVDMSGIFETGQAYVALSRCPDPNNLQVINFDKNLVMASMTCVKFYQDLDAQTQNPGELPGYSLEGGATEVAPTTETSWDNNRVQYADGALTGDPLPETQMMMGLLSLGQPSTHSLSSFEN